MLYRTSSATWTNEELFRGTQNPLICIQSPALISTTTIITTTTTVAATDTFITVTITAEYWRCYRHFTTTNAYSRLLVVRPLRSRTYQLWFPNRIRRTHWYETGRRTVRSERAFISIRPYAQMGLLVHTCDAEHFLNWPMASAVSNPPIRQRPALTCTIFELSIKPMSKLRDIWQVCRFIRWNLSRLSFGTFIRTLV